MVATEERLRQSSSSKTSDRKVIERGSVRLPFAELISKHLVQSVADVIGQSGGFGVVEDFHRLMRRIHHDAAVLAMFQVALQFPNQFGIKFAVEVFRDFIDDLSASHCGHPFRNT